MRYLSPLRYPGGKARLAPYIARIIEAQPIRPRLYAEPFAGGAGVALRLLVDEHVDRVYINDLSPAIAAFWRAVFFRSEDLADKIEQATVTMDVWYEQRRIYENPCGFGDLDLAYATFFLNRANRSGILTARPIGGLSQSGEWKIDARFNREDLARRVRFIGKYRERVIPSQLDARDFLRQLSRFGQEAFVYCDPPYLTQGDELYMDVLTSQDHNDLAVVLDSATFPWLVTYDAHRSVTEELYPSYRTVEFSIKHTAQKQHIGAEYAVFSRGLVVPEIDLLARANSRWMTV